MKNRYCHRPVLFGSLSSQAFAQQTQEGSWLVRVRAVTSTRNKSDPIGGVGASDRLTINSKSSGTRHQLLLHA